MYLGLTGRSIGAADAYALGLLTHCIPAARFEEIKTALADTWPVDTVLDDRHVDPGPGELAPYARAHRPLLLRADSVEEIVERLARSTAAGARLGATASSPISRRARRSRSRSRTGTSAMRARSTCARRCIVDYRLACRFLDGHDFYEGVRAALIDKDGKPRGSRRGSRT